MAFSLKKWIGSMLFSTFMDEYNENMGDIEDRFGDIGGLVGLGGIVENDSNANGEYVKFANGLMLCVYSQAHEYGDAEVGVNTAFSFTFPKEFVERPIVVHSLSLSNTARTANYTSSQANGDLTTIGTGLVLYIDVGTARTGFVFSYIAIGRWKE